MGEPSVAELRLRHPELERLADVREVGLFGGTFDPPHVGHVLLATYALAQAEFEAVLVVPAFAHAFGKAATPFEARRFMCELAFSVLPAPRCIVTSLESSLAVPSYTVQTVETLRAMFPHLSLRLVLGSDLVSALPRFHRADELLALAPPWVAARGGYVRRGATAVLPTISSTEVRDELARGQSVDAWVPASVRRYIERESLYAPRPRGRRRGTSDR